MVRALAKGATAADATRTDLPLTLMGLWRAFWLQPWSFKWTCIYVFFEYVRPQQVYPVLQFLPWALVSILAAGTAFLLEGRSVRSRTMANGLLLALTVVVLLSSVFAYVPSVSFDKLDVVGNWLIAFFLIANTTTDQRKFFLFVVLFLLWSAKMSQFAARSFLTGGGAAGGAPGWFQNTGEFALQMCIYVPLALHFIIGLYPQLSKVKLLLLSLLPVTGTLGIINSGSRGGLLGLACIGLWMLLRSRHKVRGFLSLAVLVPLIWAVIPQYQKARFRTAGADETSISRLTYWKAGVKMAESHPLLGVGYENWAPYYRDYFSSTDGVVTRWTAPGVKVVEVSHNSFVEVLSQLGYPALVLFIGILFSIWRINWETRRLLKDIGARGRFLREMSYGLDAGVIGFIVAGFFMAVAFNPFVWFQLGMAAALNVAAASTAAKDGGARMEQAPRTKTARFVGWRRRRLSSASIR